MKHLINISDLSVAEIEKLILCAKNIIKNPHVYQDKCKRKKLATLFFEPSTRTRLSFEAAMLELGGSVLGFSEANSSSASKGESVSDTIQTVGAYVDIIAMRHPKEGAPIVGKQRSTVPIINAGDGGHFHPTQTLTDLLTIHEEKGRLNNLVIGLCGDLKFGRTVHSLIEATLQYENISYYLISPPELSLPTYMKEKIEQAGAKFFEVTNLEAALPALDVLYMTRVQKERFFNEEDYLRLKDSCILNLAKLKLAPSDMLVLHPLPRVNEIAKDVDLDPRAVYFKQVLYGKYIRMALILYMLNLDLGI